MSAPRPATEEELHAFIDGALGSVRRDEVAQFLRDQPQLAATLV